MYMRHFFGSGSVSGSMSMSMGLPMSMSMSMSMIMIPSISMSYSMSMSMNVVAPVSPHVLYVPSFPSTASEETEHPTVSSYEPSSVSLDSSKVTTVTAVPSVLLVSRAPSVSVSMVSSSSVAQESVPNDDNIEIGASEMSVNSMGGVKSPFSDGSLPSASSPSPSTSSSSFFRDVLLPILVTLTVVSGMIVMLVVYVYDKNMNGNGNGNVL